jgi:hypothetical protein
MVEVLRSNDRVRRSWALALLSAAASESFLFAAETSAVEGSIGVIPRRLVVRDEDAARPRSPLAQGLAAIEGVAADDGSD